MKFLGFLSIGILFIAFIVPSREQRITTIQLDGVQYFVSRMNPYSPELNFYLAYQYCRSLGLQLASFETREKADSITQYLSNAGYTKYDFWTSGNKLGTDMLLWMSTGLPFNATFNYLKPTDDASSAMLTDVVNSSTAPQRTARESDNALGNNCISLKAPNFEWTVDDCSSIKDFICEQTRCYYYNYGSIPVSSAQGRPSTEKTITKPSASSLLPSSSSSSSSSPLSSSSSSSSSLPSSSSSSSSSALGMAAFINQLRTETKMNSGNPIINEPNTRKIDHDNDDDDSESASSTDGPYGINVQMQDDPSPVYRPPDVIGAHDDADSYVSTIVPDYVTTFKSVRDSHESLL